VNDRYVDKDKQRLLSLTKNKKHFCRHEHTELGKILRAPCGGGSGCHESSEDGSRDSIQNIEDKSVDGSFEPLTGGINGRE